MKRLRIKVVTERRYVQALPTYSSYDAIGNNVRLIDYLLRKNGYLSRIAAFSGDAYDENTLPMFSLDEFIDPQNDVLIYHMSIGNNLNDKIASLKAFRKIMIFHNITPPSYLYFDDIRVVELCSMGETQLQNMGKSFDLTIAVSEFNAATLRELGYENIAVVPLLTDLSFYDNISPDIGILCRYFDGKANILFVGRGTPNKCQHDIVMAYAAFRKHCPDSRLLLVGEWFENYRKRVERIIRDLGLEGHVQILGSVTDSELKALYLSSHLFLCMSEHEGFCVPLLESMRFGVPALAFAAAAVPETLGDSGVLFFEKDYEAVAQIMANLVCDSDLRNKVIEAQKKRLKDFDITLLEKVFLNVCGIDSNAC
jgi:glycosyltransferase involved in cell wall biosynthesis